MTDLGPAINTDREIYREPDKGGGDFYSDSIHVTQGGGIGINVGGSVIVKPLRDWHRLAVKRYTYDKERRTLVPVPDSDPALTATQFVVQMILAVARIYPKVTTEEAMRTASRIYRDFLRDEKIQFGSVKYAWDAEAAKSIVEASELD